MSFIGILKKLVSENVDKNRNSYYSVIVQGKNNIRIIKGYNNSTEAYEDSRHLESKYGKIGEKLFVTSREKLVQNKFDPKDDKNWISSNTSPRFLDPSKPLMGKTSVPDEPENNKTPLTNPVNKSTDQQKPKNNKVDNKEYGYYLYDVNNTKAPIYRGFKTEKEAKDHKNKMGSNGKTLNVGSRESLQRKGYDPNKNLNWGDFDN